MKNVVEIKNVKSTNGELGTMYFIASKSREAVIADNVEHIGLSIFFRNDNSYMTEYVKSFVLTVEEARLMRSGAITIVKDIGYILDVHNTYLDIMCLNDDLIMRGGYFNEQSIARATFQLNYSVNGFQKLSTEANTHRRKVCGLRRALQCALGTMMNITEDSIVSSVFPPEGNVREFDYMINEYDHDTVIADSL